MSIYKPKFKVNDTIVYTYVVTGHKILGKIIKVHENNFLSRYDMLVNNSALDKGRSAYEVDYSSHLVIDYNEIWQRVLNES